MKKHKGRIDEVRKFEMECISDPKEIVHVETFLDKVNKVAQLDDGTFYRLLVACTEAVNNAIMHGNKADARKLVCVTIIFKKNDSLTVRVDDQGNGFDPDHLPNPVEDQNLMKTSGRGVFLMRELMDRVNYRFGKSGSAVEMVINLKRLK